MDELFTGPSVWAAIMGTFRETPKESYYKSRAHILLTRNSALMDSLVAGDLLEEALPPSCDPEISNEEALEVPLSPSNENPSLLDRIGSAKVYLLSDSTQTRTAKVR